MACKTSNGFSSATISQMEEFATLPYSFRTYQRVETSSTIFRLNYGATALILIAASLAVTMKQFGGRPIECVVDKDLNVDVVNNFCWIHATFSSWKITGNFTDRSHDLSEGNVDRNAIFMLDDYGYRMIKASQLDAGPPGPGARINRYTHGILHSSGPYPGVETITDESFLRYHKYVQWVAGILIFQDVLNTFCWIHSTYTIKTAFSKQVGKEVPYPGVDSSRGNIQDQKCYRYYHPTVETDLTTLKLHYRTTTAILVMFCILLGARQLVGNPIDCVHIEDIPEDVLDTYCWIHLTYTVKSSFRKEVGKEVIAPGVDSAGGEKENIQVYPFYQWVIFCLCFQAILFYTPRWLWKNWEGGKINSLMMDLDIGICSKEEKNLKSKLLSDYLYDNLKLHNWWAYKYFFCELLALGNVVGQMFLMNRFFDGEFFNFGINVIRFMEADEEDRTDPMIFIFPRMTKCTFYKFGVSGEIERHDAVCILPLNVVNEKIYVFLWFWFLGLGLLTLGVVLYRVVIITSPRMRVYLLRLRFRLVRRDAISVLVKESKMGDWFLFYMLGVNVDAIIFRDVMHDLAKRLQHHHAHHDPMKAI